MGFGISIVFSARRVPDPPASIIVFIIHPKLWFKSTHKAPQKNRFARDSHDDKI